MHDGNLNKKHLILLHQQIIKVRQHKNQYLIANSQNTYSAVLINGKQNFIFVSASYMIILKCLRLF